MNSRKWIVIYSDGQRSRQMTKSEAKDLMEIFDGAYIKKIRGFWKRKIYRDPPKG